MRKTERKITMSFVLSPKIVEKIDRALQEGKYSGQSDLASIAITEHLLKEELESDRKKLMQAIELMIEDEDLIKIFDSISTTETSRINALRRKGMACVELGEYKEARECFAKARELENKQNPDPKNSKSEKKVLFDKDYPREYIIE